MQRRLGSFLQAARERNGQSREDVASAAGTSKGYVALVEQGHRRPSAKVLDALVATLGLDEVEAARVHVRRVLDGLEDQSDGTALDEDALDTIEAVADALILTGRSTDALADGGALNLGLVPTQREEVRVKAALELSWVLRGVANRWRESRYLGKAEYFADIIREMAHPGLSRVYAVNTIDPRRWTDDTREVAYLEAHAGALSRDAGIKRIFVLDDHSDDGLRALQQAVAANLEANVKGLRLISRNRISLLSDQPEDAVCFVGSEVPAGGEDGPSTNRRVLYIGHSDADDRTRVEFGEVVVDAEAIERYVQYFRLLWDLGEKDFEKFARSLNPAWF